MNPEQLKQCEEQLYNYFIKYFEDDMAGELTDVVMEIIKEVNNQLCP